MTKARNSQSQPDNLRVRAEERLRSKSSPPHRAADGDTEAALHELRVHESELQMQNESLREAQARLEEFSTILRTLQDGFCVVDTQGHYVEANEAYCRMLDVDRDELLQMAVWDVMEPESHPKLACHVQKAVQRGWDKFPLSHRRKDGRVVHCDVTLQRLKSDRLFVIARDTTTQRLAEERSIESLQRFHLVARATNDGIWDWDIATDACWRNPAYSATFGYRPEEVRPDTNWWRERIHPDDREAVLSTLAESIQGASDAWTAKYRFRRRDDSYAWVMDRGCIVRNEQGDVVRIVGSMMDLTEKLGLIDQLEAERTKLGAILDTAMAGIVVVDDQARITYSNRVAQELYHSPLPFGQAFGSCEGVEARYSDGRPYTHQDIPLVRSALQGETFTEVNMLVTQPDGRSRHLLVNAGPLRDAQGRIVGAVGVLHDITELKQAEQALREAQGLLEHRVRERTAELDATVETLHEEVAEKIEAQDRLTQQNEMLQRIISNVPVMLCFFDAEGRVGVVNDEFTRVLGYSLGDFQQRSLKTLAGPAQEEHQAFWDHMLTQEPWWRDFLVRTKDGQDVISSWATVGLPGGSYVGIGIDIRQRREFENRLRESEQRYRTLVELSPDAIGVERDGIIRFVNSTAVKLLGGHRHEDLVGRPVLDMVHPDHRARAKQQFKVLRRRRPLAPSEDRIIRLDGKTVDVELTAMPILFEGRPANQIVLRDITIRKEQERRIQEHQHELASLTEKLLLTEERERHRLALMLHDSIGQSLSFSKRELGVLQKKSGESIREDLEYVKEQIELAIRQTRDLTFELSPTTLHTFGLEAAVEELAEQFASRETLRCHFEATDDDKPLSEQIRTLLYRAARELLTNIVKHADATNVSIHIDRQEENVRMVVEDNGKGFDTSQLEQIARHQEGLGLFSIRERLTYVGGRLVVESQPGTGTKVTLTAPLNDSE